MNPKSYKRTHERAVSFNITIPAALVPELEKVLQRYHFKGVSDYIQARVRKDAGLELIPS